MRYDIPHPVRDDNFYVYIMASRSRTLYIGVTSKIDTRVFQHKNDAYEGFSRTYHCHRLVYVERYQYAATAVAREKQLKRWSRSKKIALIERDNPSWAELSEGSDQPMEAAILRK